MLALVVVSIWSADSVLDPDLGTKDGSGKITRRLELVAVSLTGTTEKLNLVEVFLTGTME